MSQLLRFPLLLRHCGRWMSTTGSSFAYSQKSPFPAFPLLIANFYPRVVVLFPRTRPAHKHAHPHTSPNACMCIHIIHLLKIHLYEQSISPCRIIPHQLHGLFFLGDCTGSAVFWLDASNSSIMRPPATPLFSSSGFKLDFIFWFHE